MAKTLSCSFLSNSLVTAIFWCGSVFEFRVEQESPGLIVAWVEDRAHPFLRAEAGGHRWQRVPPTEKRGRTHTSTVTVAVLTDHERADVKVAAKDLRIICTRGSGPGGQHKNKTETAVHVLHKPTGERIYCDGGRSQSSNKAEAVARLESKIKQAQNRKLKVEQDSMRRLQVGSGMRGDKIRTISTARDRVTDHRTGKSCRIRDLLNGRVDLLI